MSKLDLKKELSSYYNPSKKDFSLVELPSFQFLMVDGCGNPNTTPEYQEAVSALYSLSYHLKFALKKDGIEYGVMPLEGLWWMDDMREFTVVNKDRWKWTMMILQPSEVTLERVEAGRQELSKKKDVPALSQVRLESYAEGLSAQILYLGAYVDEAPTIAALHAWLNSQGYEPHLKHHEIYLGDPRKTAPDKLKTILRQPVRLRVTENV